MERTRTLWVDINRLHRSDPSGLVLRMMMAANDIALANWGLTEFKKPQPRLSRHMQNGACLYFIRLQCGHLSEALKLVGELNKDSDSKAGLERCNETARQAYSTLNSCLPGGRTTTGSRIGWSESVTTFHSTMILKVFSLPSPVSVRSERGVPLPWARGWAFGGSILSM
jgi:hypothetical protein